MEVKRLFDILKLYVENHPKQDVALARKEKGSWKKFSIQEYVETTNNLSYAFIKLGIKKDDKVGIICSNRPEWNMLDMAIMQVGAVSVPIYPTISKEDYRYIINDCGVKLIVLEGTGVLQKIDEVKAEAPNLEAIYALSTKCDYPTFEQLVELGKENQNPEELKAREESVDEKDCATIIYTSGTTGNPKGVMLSHKNFISDGFIAQKNFNHYPTDVFYALLPIHHAYTMQAAFINPMLTGASIVFGKSMAVTRLLKELREGKITVMLGVPLLYNKLLAGIRKGIKEKGAFVSGLLNGLCNFSYFLKRYLHINIGKLIFKPVLQKASIYTLRVAISGGGPLAASVFKQYNGMGIDFIQGYGLTETSPILTLNPVDKFKIHSVGQAFFPYMDVKIINKDEKSHRKVERQIGEIVVKGPMVMQGYYNMPEETAAMFTEDGYLKTGDLGWMDKDHYVMLCGRAKNLIVTSGGKNVYPEEIEDAFQLCDDIQQITVQGYIDNEETKSEAIEALIYPSDALYERLGLTRDTVAQEEVLKAIQMDVNKVNKTLQPYSIITKITILDEPLAMTTTQKVKRNYKK
jgi:long-chain acyl-CoA synthetase